jgi:hypothetical protein
MVPVTVVGHEVDIERHPTVPPGWRWCAMLGAEPWDDQSRMLNAGWCPQRNEAFVEGEAVGIAVAKALSALGHQVDYKVTELDHDPIPAEP